MKERLKIENFGPVKHLDIEIKPLTLFIGTQGSGKSTISKIITIFRNQEWEKQIEEINKDFLMKAFFNFNIDEYFQTDSYISYINNHIEINYQNGEFSSKHLNEKKEAYSASSSMLYIPAERNLVGNLSSALASIILAKVPLSETIIEYMSLFEKAKKEFPKYEIPFLGVSYEKKDGKERIVVSEEGKSLPLNACSSGLQSVLPMIMVMDYALQNESFDSFVVEEPEQNLFPENQRELLNFTCSKLNTEHFKQCVITTHSPYMLSCLNVLMLAAKLQQIEDVKEESEKIISSEYAVNPTDVAVYGLYPTAERNDYCKSLIAERTGLISINELDSVSEMIGERFDQLYQLYLKTFKKK